MSFIYAENKESFAIFSDTKITTDDRLEKQWNSSEEKHLLEQIGSIKSIIISPNIVICYAGNNLDKAAELLRIIKSRSDNLEDIVALASHIHNNSGENMIEFLVAYCDDYKRELISIKNNLVVRNCTAAWIGSLIAYKKFKELEEQYSKRKTKNQYDYLCIRECFLQAIESGTDPTVGGMVVSIKALEYINTFQYMEQVTATTSSWPQTIIPGERVKFFEGAGKGSYSCFVYQSKKDFCYYVYENNSGIVYTDEVSFAKGLEGLKFPVIYKVDRQQFDVIAERHGACSNISYA